MPISPSSQQEFSDAEFRVVDNGDQSKKVAFQVSGVSANTTRTLTVQNADGTIAYVNNQTFTGTTTVNLLSVTGGQIAFPATQNPSSDPNTLDDYEEGTWTPTLTFGGNATGLTYSTRSGVYAKVGRLVMAGGIVALTAKGSSTGVAEVSGLPFTIETDTQAGATPNLSGGSFASLTAGIVLIGTGGTAGITMRVPNTTGMSNGTNTHFTNTSGMFFTMSYIED